MHGPHDMNRPYVVIGSHCPVCGLQLEERGQAMLLLDFLEGRPATTRAGLRKLQNARYRSKTKPQ